MKKKQKTIYLLLSLLVLLQACTTGPLYQPLETTIPSHLPTFETPARQTFLPPTPKITHTISIETSFPVTQTSKANIAPLTPSLLPIGGQAVQLKVWNLPEQNVMTIKWAPGGESFLAATTEGVSLYNVDTLQRVWNIPPLAPAYVVSAAAFTPDNQSLILYDNFSGLKLHDTQTGNLLSENPQDSPTPVNCLLRDATESALSIDGRSIFVTISLEDRTQGYITFSEIHTWDTQSLTCQDILIHVEGHARTLDISTDGRYLALGIGKNATILAESVIEDGQIFIRDLETGQDACLIDKKGSIARFKPDSSLLLVPDPVNDRFTYWDVSTCQEVGELSGITTRYELSFRPDGRYFAFWNNGIQIADAGTGEILARIEDPILDDVFPTSHLDFNILTFSPNGQYLIYSNRINPTKSFIFLWRIED